MAKKKYDAGRVFTKVMAGVLAILMLFTTIATLVYYLIAY